MGKRVFDDGVMVRINGGEPREVRDGREDSDGEIKVWNRDRSDWSYYSVDVCTLADEPQCGVGTCQDAPTNSNQAITSEGTATMANQKVTRSIVRVHLVDEDAGLDVSKSLVKDFGTHVMEGSQEELIQEILMDTDANVESALRAHNAVRAKETDLDIRQRTGNEVKLQAVKLRDLTWKVTAA